MDTHGRIHDIVPRDHQATEGQAVKRKPGLDIRGFRETSGGADTGRAACGTTGQLSHVQVMINPQLYRRH